MRTQNTLFLLLLICCCIHSKVFANNTIVILGDSISSAYGISPDSGWVNLLRQRLEQSNYRYQVHNASISGDTTSNGLDRLQNLLTTIKPDIVVVELGGNDGLRGHPLPLMQSNLTQMIALSRAQHAKVLLLGIRLPPNYGRAFTKRFEKVYTDVAEAEQVALAPYILENIGGVKALMQVDGVHPNENAQTIILDNIWPYLEKLLINSNEHSS